MLPIRSQEIASIEDRGTKKEEVCSSNRELCSNCCTLLRSGDQRWPELICPFVSAISRVADTEDDDMHGGKQVELGEMPDWSASAFGEGPYLQVGTKDGLFID